MAEKDGGFAFPGEHQQREDLPNSSTGFYQEFSKKHPGMTLRDYFAAQLIDGASRDLVEPEDIARRAYSVADAMIARRAK